LSRADPLAPLEEDLAASEQRRERIRRIARITLAWFVGFMLVSGLLRYMVRYVV